MISDNQRKISRGDKIEVVRKIGVGRGDSQRKAGDEAIGPCREIGGDRKIVRER